MNRIKAALQMLVKGTPMSIRDPEHWRNRDTNAPTGEAVTANSVLGLSAVWACVNLIAGTIAALPLMIYSTDAKGARSLATSHPLYRVLHDSPNSLQTSLDFWEFMCASLELWGNAYARKVRSGDRVVGLMPIMPDLPTVESIGNGRLLYRWTEDGRSFELTSDDVLHIRGFGGNPLGGMSTLAFGARAFGLAIAIDRAAGSTFRNGLRPSGVLKFEKFLTTEQRDIVETKLTEKFMGAMNSGRPLVLEGGTDWAQLGINPDDAQMLQSRGFSVEEVCRFFGTPPIMIGHGEKTSSWGTGVQEVTLGFEKYTLRRRVKRIEQALEKQLLTPEDRAAGIIIEFNLEGLLRGDSAGRSAFYTAALGDTQKPGWMLRNEVRRLENLEPVPGWDEPIQLITTAPQPAALPPPKETTP
ncbi:MAG: phage portal protein family [Devosia sp.]|uniref:phage portal protein n=1 Tax=Devosia sp. TaxID=1871048 RepID=UPI0026259DAC|nr:phage portal protein [Devosia sp.]MDB5540535.1 phage portal protein family [Devosia sp.]